MSSSEITRKGTIILEDILTLRQIMSTFTSMMHRNNEENKFYRNIIKEGHRILNKAYFEAMENYDWGGLGRGWGE